MILSLGNLNSKILIADTTSSSSRCSIEKSIDICNRKKIPKHVKQTIVYKVVQDKCNISMNVFIIELIYLIQVAVLEILNYLKLMGKYWPHAHTHTNWD